MHKNKMIALAYNNKMIVVTCNNSCKNTGTNTLDKLLNGENEILQKGNKIIWSRKAKLLDDLKDCIKNNPRQEATVFVTKLKYNSNQTEEHNDFFNSVNGLIKNTEIAVIFLLECQDKVNSDSELLQFFDLIIEE
jgi:hypothetical protein